MSFTEWFKQTYQEDWEMDYTGLYGFASEVADQYGDYCQEKNLEPLYDG